jgi:hypothetical protein
MSSPLEYAQELERAALRVVATAVKRERDMELAIESRKQAERELAAHQPYTMQLKRELAEARAEAFDANDPLTTGPNALRIRNSELIKRNLEQEQRAVKAERELAEAREALRPYATMPFHHQCTHHECRLRRNAKAALGEEASDG